MEEKKPLAYVVVALVVIAGLGYFVLSSPEGSTGAKSEAEQPLVVKQNPEFSDEELLGEATLDDSQTAAILAHKQEILRIVATNKPFTEEEKGAIADVMSNKAQLYKFTPDERESIFAAFKR